MIHKLRNLWLEVSMRKASQCSFCWILLSRHPLSFIFCGMDSSQTIKRSQFRDQSAVLSDQLVSSLSDGMEQSPETNATSVSRGATYMWLRCHFHSRTKQTRSFTPSIRLYILATCKAKCIVKAQKHGYERKFSEKKV